MNQNKRPILVIGGGIAGMTAALEAAEAGYRVILVEKEPYLGGRVVRMYRYFPKMCPPTCGFEINTRRIRQNPRIAVYTMASVREITGNAGNFKARIRLYPGYLSETTFITDDLIEQLSRERDNDFNYGMDKTQALYMPHEMAYPHTYTIDKNALNENDTAVIQGVAGDTAVDLDMPEREINIRAGAVILATGWKPYDAARIDNLGYGQFPNVVTNVMMERLASKGGPTDGKIVRPSDGKLPENIAFVQCAGSRDENHLPYCSAVCCMASLKQVRYLREQNENAGATVFYIDIRTIGRLEKFYYDMLDDDKISFVKGKVAAIGENHDSGNLILDVEDTLTRNKLHEEFDMVVLATGIVPNIPETKFPFELNCDLYGFVDGSEAPDGIYPVGCVRNPCDVSLTTKEATAAALRAIQRVNRGD